MTKESKVLITHNLSVQIDDDLVKKFEKAKTNQFCLEDFLQEFLGQFISEQTKRAYVGDLNAFFSFLKKGNISINHPRQIKAFHFQIYRDDLMAKNQASSTINRKLVAIRSFMKWSLACQHIEFNPLDALKLPKVQNNSTTLAFDDEEVLKMLNAPDLSTPKGLMHKMAMVLLFALGLRRNELTHLKFKSIFKDRGHIVIKILGKGNKERFLPLTQNLYNEIIEYKQKMQLYGIDLKEDDYIIQTKESYQKSHPVDGSTIFRIIQRYAKKSNIHKTVGPHSCRATAISHLLDTQKTPIRDVAIFAGHSKITTTERYDKRRESLDDSAAYAINYNKKKSA